MMTAHIEWFERMLTTAIQLYFQQGCEYASIEEVTPPADEWLEGMTGRQEITFNERVIIMLALMPHTCPQALDIFFVQNKNFDRQYTEFGGWKGLSHGGFLPTGETASFIIAGEDMEKKKAVIHMFQRDHWFYTQNILRLEGAGEGEPFLSGQLRPSEEFLSHVLLDWEYKPDYTIGFPAKLITTPLEWEDMILDYNTYEALEEINTWIAHQHTIMEDWGLKRILKPGYRALFYGEGFSTSIEDESDQMAGYGCVKFRNVRSDGQPNQVIDYVNTDLPLFRIAEAYLTYAEASTRLNGPNTDASNRINALRNRAHASTQNIYTLDNILDEWSREFWFEGRRRIDLIRFGRFAGQANYRWEWMGGTYNGAQFGNHMNIFAIPENDLTNNENLHQNTGY